MKSLRAAAVVVLPLLAPAVATAHGQPPRAELKTISVDVLKGLYLSCNDGAASGRMGNEGIMYCSLVYEELKERVFGGDFHRLIAWSRAQKAPARDSRR